MMVQVFYRSAAAAVGQVILEIVKNFVFW